MAVEELTWFRSFDGLRLAGTITRPASPGGAAAVLVHGGGVTREEGGFYARLAAGIAAAGIAVLRFDLRGHGDSEGCQEDLTICSVANDIEAAIGHVQDQTGSGAAHLYGTSFSGGICAFFAAQHAGWLRSLTLANPLLDYKRRFIDEKPYWHDERIDAEAGRLLAERGYLEHSPTFRLGRPLLNEVFRIDPRTALSTLAVPVLFLHGTRDTFIPIESSRAAVAAMAQAEVRLVEIDGAQHGFAVHDDPGYEQVETQQWQASVISAVTGWMAAYGK